MPAVADIVVRRLLDAGVRTLFGVPGGGSSLDLIDAAGRAGLPFVLTATETAGAIAAIAQAEITGAPGACLTALGPGASSVMNGAAAAYLDRVPLIIFTDGPPSGAQEYDHQRLHLAPMFAPTAKHSCRLVAGNVVGLITGALVDAAADQPGPIHIEWPAGLSEAADEPSGGWYSHGSIAIPDSSRIPSAASRLPASQS